MCCFLRHKMHLFMLAILGPSVYRPNWHILKIPFHLLQLHSKLQGVYTCKNLNFESHISEWCTRTSQRVGILVRLRNLIPCNAKLMLCNKSILPYFTYCHLVWKFCKSSDSKRSSASKSVHCAQYMNPKLKRRRNCSLAPNYLRFITDVCKTVVMLMSECIK